MQYAQKYIVLHNTFLYILLYLKKYSKKYCIIRFYVLYYNHRNKTTTKNKGGLKMKLFAYYQPNNKDIKDNYGDCQIRALSKALNLSWLETFDLIIPICREVQATAIFDSDLKVINKSMEKLGFTYNTVSNKKGCKRPTVASFTAEHKNGTYIVRVANHVVCVKDGQYFDTWDSGRCSLYGYYKLNT